MFLLRVTVAAFIAIACVLLPHIAHAELGGPLSSVSVDRGRLGAQMKSVATGHYARHELTRPNGGMVREFTNAKGEVFAVTWAGPGKPDLRSVLGRYFAALQTGSGATGRSMHSLRRPAQVSDADLQIQTGGHMGWFHGVAFVPSLAPAGFSTSDLPQP
ncbi:DUF2844 domain-containing protein [uncultured Sphingomonas sp.]|uniref:DUF2844 domain-containing protein n=1 Tax=uncultured Sphingomonas sp. TaxID=158754 RepID=UPI0035CC80DE